MQDGARQTNGQTGSSETFLVSRWAGTRLILRDFFRFRSSLLLSTDFQITNLRAKQNEWENKKFTFARSPDATVKFSGTLPPCPLQKTNFKYATGWIYNWTVKRTRFTSSSVACNNIVLLGFPAMFPPRHPILTAVIRVTRYTLPYTLHYRRWRVPSNFGIFDFLGEYL